MHLGMHSQVFDQMEASSTRCPVSRYFFFFFTLCVLHVTFYVICRQVPHSFLIVALEYSMLEWLYHNLFKGIIERHLNCFQWFCYNRYCAMTTEFLCCCYSCARVLIG